MINNLFICFIYNMRQVGYIHRTPCSVIDNQSKESNIFDYVECLGNGDWLWKKRHETKCLVSRS